MIFIDTGAFIANYLAHDQHHTEAVKLWRSLENSSNKICTSNFVIDETITLLARKSNYDFAAKKAEIIYSSNKLNIIRVDEKLEILALNIFMNYAGQKLSFTDSTSFAIMQQNNIKTAFSFDRHFEYAGFDLLKA